LASINRRNNAIVDVGRGLVFFDNILNSTEDNDLLEGVSVSDHTHRVIANEVQLIRIE